MNATVLAHKPSTIGDYDLRGQDYETMLAGPVTDSIIDAARLVRVDWSNGMPNWDLYRVVFAGDNLYIPHLRQWTVAFAIAHCMDGGVRRDAYSDEFACIAAWDALHILIHQQELQPYTVSALGLGVDHKTYRRLRDAIYARLSLSLTEYMMRMGIAFRQVKFYERKAGTWNQQGILKVRESFVSDTDLAKGGDGNYIRQPATDSDNL
jgi:hypothetical protein